MARLIQCLPNFSACKALGLEIKERNRWFYEGDFSN